MADSIVTAPDTLSPLPPILRRGLTAVTCFGFLSFITSFALFLRLSYRLVTWKRKSHARFNQFIILIFNLVFADLQQSVAFLLNVQWLRTNQITIDTPICWAQGWFVSTGDLASGVFTLAIAVHSFMDIVFNLRLRHTSFLITIGGLWTFVYMCAIIGIAMHPEDFYVRAGAWCWINGKYSNERLWLHYFWILVAEFSTVLIYCLIFLILRRRVAESFYTSSATAVRAKEAARLIIAYPFVYVICTLPLASARLTSMTGGSVSFIELCVAGAMITSNGWLDVLLYSITRRALLFGPEIQNENANALETFRFRPDQTYGTTTTIEANMTRTGSRKRAHPGGLEDYRHGSTEELFGLQGVKTETVVHISSDPLELQVMGRDTGGPMSSEGDLRKSFDERSDEVEK